MQITDIRIRHICHEGHLRAMISCTFDKMLAVHEIKVIQGAKRLFVAMPNRIDNQGVSRDIVHPISSEIRRQLEAEILEAYQKCLEEIKLYSQKKDTEAPTDFPPKDETSCYL